LSSAHTSSAAAGTSNELSMLRARQHTFSAMRRLEGRRALVTGGGSGIGRAVACRLAEEGAVVAVSGRREAPLAKTVAAIEAAGGRSLAVVGDIAVESDADRMATAAAEGLGGLDVLVNNAGSIRRNVLVHELTLERWREQVGVNLDGPFLVARAALRLMLEETGDRSIVNIGSTLALAAAPGVSAYTAAKGGLVALTRAIAVEYAERGIRCNCVCPAIVVTPLAYTDRPQFDEQRGDFEGMYPLGRLGEPGDVAGVVAYLVSTDSSWVTGAVFPVDGGFTAT
jgi:NAD(P)-dependent dehydrogenase (short-subunit alcohol dehydrogenase family)